MATAYFAAGPNVVAYDVDTDAVEGPWPLADFFPGCADHGFDQGVDAVLDIGIGRWYVFSGTQYLRTVDGGTDVEAVDSIADRWPGMGSAGFDSVDGAVNWGDGKVYFFRGSSYLRYDLAADRVDPGYPKPIAGNWRGVDASWVGSAGVDGVLYTGGDRAYLFGSGDYVALAWHRKAQLPGYPVTTADAWTGLASLGTPDAVWSVAANTGPSGDLSDAFVAGVRDVATDLGCAPLDLLGVMMSESDVDPSAQNPLGGATGLIQFMPAILSGLGWVDGQDAFARLAAEDQLPYVQKFFAPYARHGLTSPGRLYQATFLPGTLAAGQGPGTVLAAAGGPHTQAYTANRGLDVDGDGAITIGDLDARIAAVQTGRRWTDLASRI